MKHARQLALHIVMADIPRLRGDCDELDFEDRLAIGLDTLFGGEPLQEIGDLAHFQMRVGPQRLVLFVFIKFVPPFVAARIRTGRLALTSVVELKHRPTIVFIFPLEPDAFAGRQKGDGAELDPVSLNGQGVQVGQQPPLSREFVDGNIDPLAPRISLAAMSEPRIRR